MRRSRVFVNTHIREAKQLYRHFRNCAAVAIIPPSEAAIAAAKNTFGQRLQAAMPKYYTIVYPNQQTGIKWELRMNNFSPGFIRQIGEDKSCNINATINPKIFAGIKEYVAAATASHIQAAMTRFNEEAREISSLLGAFDDYSFHRIDYCVNFSLKKLGIDATAAQMMELIRRGDVPPHFSGLTVYDRQSHRRKAVENSLYLQNNSVTVNCYDKDYQLRNQFADCPDIDNAIDVVRFEVQYKYLKIYSSTKRLGPLELSAIMAELFSEETCAGVIETYFDKVVTRGGYYSLKRARKMIEACNFRKNKEKRPIGCLTKVNLCRGIAKAKAMLAADELAEFKRTIKDLALIGINPVTIPREWGVKHIPNLLEAFYKPR